VSKISRCDKCEAPGEVYLHSRCHPHAPTWAILNQSRNDLRIICSECEKVIVTFSVTGTA